MGMHDDDPWFDDYYDSEPEVLTNVKVLHETDKAYLINYRGSHAWFPKSIAKLDENDLVYDDWFIPEWRIATQRKRMSAIEGDFE